MFSVTGATVSSPTIQPGGGQTTIRPIVVDPTQTMQGTLYDDQGGSYNVQLTVAAENITYTTDPTKKGQPGYLYFALSAGAPATAAVGADGVSFLVTAN